MIVSPKNDITEQTNSGMLTILNMNAPYFVYAIEKRLKHTYYYVLDNNHAMYPMAYRSDLFSIVDNSLPTTWETKKVGRAFSKMTVTSFPDWIADLGSKGKISFYEKLVDASIDDPETKLFLRWMDDYEPLKLNIRDKELIETLEEIIEEFAPDQKWFSERLRKGEPVSMRRAEIVKDSLANIYNKGLDNRGGELVPGAYKVGGVVADLDKLIKFYK